MKQKIDFNKVFYTVEVDNTTECASISVNEQKAENVYYEPKHERWYAPFSMQGNDFWVVAGKNRIRLVPCVSGMSAQDFIHDYATRAYGGLIEFIFTLFGIFAPSVAAVVIAYVYHVDIPTGILAGIVAVSCVWFTTCNTSIVVPLHKKKKLCFLALLGPVLCFALFGIGLII